jgi:hypothetical protein
MASLKKKTVSASVLPALQRPARRCRLLIKPVTGNIALNIARHKIPDGFPPGRAVADHG